MPHVDRLGGVKAAGPTEWEPRSKPIWFTELGCPAANKGTNQPNVFHDPKSSESFFPYHLERVAGRLHPVSLSAGDVRALERPGEQSAVGPLLRAAWWTWPGRMSGPGTRGPGPIFRTGWRPGSDGTNHARGHWLNGRTSLAALAEVVAEICGRCDLTAIDVGRLHGGVTGYAIEAMESGRQSLQPLMLAYAFDSFAIDGALAFASRGGAAVSAIEPDRCVVVAGQPVVSRTRAPLGGGAPAGSWSGSSAPTPTTRRGGGGARAPMSRNRRPSGSSCRSCSAAPRRGGSSGGRCRRPASLGTRCGVSLPASQLRLTPGDMVARRGLGAVPDRPDRGGGPPGGLGGARGARGLRRADGSGAAACEGLGDRRRRRWRWCFSTCRC